MISPDPTRIATSLTANERTALYSLPTHDRGDLPDDLWWAYYSILDQGLAASDGNFLISATPLGDDVLRLLREA